MDPIVFQPKETYRVSLNGMSITESLKIHIMYVLDGVYEDEKLIVFRYYSKRYKSWIQKLIIDEELNWRIQRTKK